MEVDEFASVFVEFMQAMNEAAGRPEPLLFAKLQQHLGVDPSELPVTSAEFSVADRPNLQLALDAVVADREVIGVTGPHVHRMHGGGFAFLLTRHGPGSPFGQAPVEYRVRAAADQVRG